ncbi:endonuclease domain-containing protein [Deinococcus frigens]|uniref:endonuclease domain-containing protein n=1 Tax=Deinococcus frigens TaxID=249403 RepID=UPI000495E4D9|nr:endonuclease domain-containing protein [Deinococcus frigens]
MRDIHTKTLVPRARELRREQTPAERKLWFLFLRTYPVKFRRQVPLLGYVLDFYAPSLRLCIKLDGRSHDSAEAQTYDAERSRVLAGAGVRVLRFGNAEVEGNFVEVCAGIVGRVPGLRITA